MKNKASLYASMIFILSLLSISLVDYILFHSTPAMTIIGLLLLDTFIVLATANIVLLIFGKEPIFTITLSKCTDYIKKKEK